MNNGRDSKNIPGPRARKIVTRMNRQAVNSTFAYPLVIKTGKGCYLEDVDGNRFLDFTANIASCPLGYGHPRILEVLKAYSKFMANKIAGQDFYCREHVEIIEAILRISSKNLARVLLTNSGAEAVENAIKLAYRIKGPLVGISFERAFHGRTLGALTFTFSKEVHKKNYPQLPATRVKFCTKDDDPKVDSIHEVLAKDPEAAFVMMELVQGEGGLNFASKKLVDNIVKASKQYDIPLIIDEVQSGVGRTGKWWAYEHYRISPNICSAAKALQIGATICEERFNPERGAVSSTWGGGDRIDMAIGMKIIEVIERDKLLEHATRMGTYLMKRLAELKSKKKGIRDVRGLGLMIGVEFETKKQRDGVIETSFRNGLLLLGCGEKTLRIIPPLIIQEEQIDEGIGILEKVI